MVRSIQFLALWGLTALACTGCSFYSIGPVKLDFDKIGTGESVFSYRQDEHYSNGEPTNYRQNR